MTPIQYYEKLLQSDQILPDPQQANVIQHLQRIFDDLMSPENQGGLFQKFSKKYTRQIQGLYLWGSVGIGKTFLMDSFYYCLPFKEKLRSHFHAFMQMIHQQMQQFRGEKDPISKIAKQIAKNNRVICFDELVVNDITDAMILAGLFTQLYKEHICILYTSNTTPDDLYLKGIQRESFLPAIDLIKQHSNIIHLTSPQDYRYREYDENTNYYTPINEATNSLMAAQFEKLRGDNSIRSGVLQILGREIPIKKMTDRVVWFDFLALCGIPRSQNDYLAIAKQFDTILISDLNVIEPEQNDLARAFINLVDVLYDGNNQLIIAAEKPIEEIYYCGRLLFEFARTRSRLVEMQTRSWQQKHRGN